MEKTVLVSDQLQSGYSSFGIINEENDITAPILIAQELEQNSHLVEDKSEGCFSCLGAEKESDTSCVIL